MKVLLRCAGEEWVRDIPDGLCSYREPQIGMRIFTGDIPDIPPSTPLVPDRIYRPTLEYYMILRPSGVTSIPIWECKA